MKAYHHWTTLEEPAWAKVEFPPIDYQAVSYYSAPKQKIEGPKSIDEVDPELLGTYEKLGIPLREQEVLAHLAEGASNIEIGDTLGISPKTVARHRENIMRKLNLHSRTELVKYAIRKGIIEP